MTTDIELRKLAERLRELQGVLAKGGTTRLNDSETVRQAIELIDRLEKAEKALEQQKDEWLSWNSKRDALEKDAGRYRWLRDNKSKSPQIEFNVDEDDGLEPWPPEELDAAIDAAMEATK